MQPERKLEFEMDEWAGCYRENWSGLIVPAAFAHPAKFSRSLVRRIYEHARDEGWLVPGTRVIDPFGGVALGGLDAAWMGAEWVGYELEAKFKALAESNIAAWNERFGSQAGWCQPRILLGDSRKLASVVEEAGLLVSSPPYSNRTVHGDTGIDFDKLKEPARKGNNSQIDSMERYGQTDGNLGNLRETQTGFDLAVSSPPYAGQALGNTSNYADPEKAKADSERDIMRGKSSTYPDMRYGTEPGQLGAMKDNGFNLAVSSPPYVESLASDDPDKRGGLFKDPKRRGDKTLTAEYGTSEGQVGAMKDGGFDLAVSSPPWEKGAEGVLRKDKFKDPEKFAAVMSGNDGQGGRHAASPKARLAQMERDSERVYGDTYGQLGGMKGGEFDIAVSSPPYEGGGHHAHQMDAWNKNGRGQPGYEKGYASEASDQMANAFWSAARQIVEQTYQVLVPGARAIWVVKGFVRKKQYVDFPDQWRQLCEAVGFKTLHWHNALLVESHGAQERFDGGTDEIETARKSFFRRLAESKGSPKIDFEVVLCLEKS